MKGRRWKTAWWIIILALALGALLLWSGCNGPKPQATYSLTVQQDGLGTVNPAVGTHSYTRDTVVTLEASETEAGWTFQAWEGVDSVLTDPKQAQVVMDRNRTVKAVFSDGTTVDPTPGNQPGDSVSHTAQGVSFNMHYAPAARYQGGLDDTEPVIVENPFWMGETAVDYELWYAVRVWAGHNGYLFSGPGQAGSDGVLGAVPAALTKDQPATNVTWRDAIVWCNALSTILGLEPVYERHAVEIKDHLAADWPEINTSSNGFRLPTTREWELAARYIGPSVPDPGCEAAYMYHDLYWTPGYYLSGAHNTWSTSEQRRVATYGVTKTDSVMARAANVLGLRGMSGNVWEWTLTTGTESWQRFVRGGAFNSTWLWNDPALRIGHPGESRHRAVGFTDTGFRLARNAD